MKTIYIIAGEASGDFIGSHLMRALTLEYKQPIEFKGVGGPLMMQEGLQSLFPIAYISLMGFLEIVPHIFKIKKLIEKTAQDIIASNPKLLITIDSPGFTYRVAARVRALKPDLKILHVVAPSVWAYKPGRAKKYAKIYDYLLALLPFEPPYFEAVGLPCSYIGHPFLEQKFYTDKVKLKTEFNINPAATVICVTPGSRKGEILQHMPSFAGALDIIARQYSELEVIFVLANKDHEVLVRQFLNEVSYKYRFSTESLKAFGAADAAIAKSGTNTLEIAASGTPMIVAYRLKALSFWIVKSMIKIKYACLINIIPTREIIPEFIQNNCTSENIAVAILKLLSDPGLAQKQLEDAHKILRELGLESHSSPSTIAAKVVSSYLK